MNILMLTNVYAPQIGGVTRSVQQFAQAFRQQGHHVLIVAPEYDTDPEGEPDVIRIPAIPKFYQDQYPLPLPALPALIPTVRNFEPEIVHVHHPFLLGSIGQVIAADQNVPLVYTHHTRYSIYIETKTNWPRSVEEGVLELITGFCELCNGIIVPSEGIGEMLRERGVEQDMKVVPTGVDLDRFATGRREPIRKRLGISSDTFLIGHVGRLSTEKNCEFLIRAVARFLKDDPQAAFLAVGDGPLRQSMEQWLHEQGLANQVFFTGFLEGDDLINAYHAMDVFAFASHSETQGMVLGEAMAAGAPVVAVDGTGVRDILDDGVNGRLIDTDDEAAFAAALASIRDGDRQALRQGALETAQKFSQAVCAQAVLDYYDQLIQARKTARVNDWERLQEMWDARWNLWRNRARAVAAIARETFQIDDDDKGDQREQSLDTF